MAIAVATVSRLCDSGEEYGASDAMRWAWGVYGILALLPVRRADYDWWVGGNPYAIRLGQAPRRHAPMPRT